MRTIEIDPQRLRIVQTTTLRERARLGAEQDRLAGLVAQSDALRRKRRTLAGQAGSEDLANEVNAQIDALDAAILLASADLEAAKDRASAAIRLRNACDEFLAAKQGETSFHVR